MAPAEAEVKPRYKLAMYWASACGGCDIAVLNLGMKLIEFTERWEPVFWPAAMDAKRADVRGMEDDEIDVCLFDGGIRTDEDAEMAHLLRAKSKVLVAFGSCASEGCIPGLANQRGIESVFAAAYDPELNDVNGEGTPNGPWESPYGELELPTLQLRLQHLGQVVDVDYSVPGCPPETERIAEVLGAVTAALDGTGPLPPKGAVLGAGNSTVCDECTRERGDQDHQGVQAHPDARGGRSQPVPARAGSALLRTGRAGRLRREVSRRRCSMHRLLRRDAGCQ